MDLRFTEEEVAFRKEVRDFIRQNLPAKTRERLRLGYSPTKQDIVDWQRILNKKGWATYKWPKEYGGTDWSPTQRMIFQEENQLGHAPEVNGFNITMIGPVIIQFGTPEQKAHILPRAANLEDWWCQGFSEPGSGSDLASLKTAAKRVGDDYIVNGQKIWTSTAHHADWCFALVRTDPNARKPQEGISFLLIDMKTPGITVRPIISIDGSHHLNEVFFDDVKVPVANRVYEENKGWDVAKFLLGNERTGIARLGKSMERINYAQELAREVRQNGRPLIEDPGFRQRVAKLQVQAKALELTQLRVVAKAAGSSDGKPDPFSSVLKIKGTELLQDTAELVMDIAGPLAMPDWARELDLLNREAGDNEPAIGPEWAGYAAPPYLMLRAASIYGGTNEIQKNILNKAILRL
jgi:alkylation response protein AidB-like acyl-CoA dehydrogenase